MHEKTTEKTSDEHESFKRLSFGEKTLSLIRGYADVQSAVESQSKRIAAAAKGMARAYLRGNDIIFVGSGTSGRLGVLQAAENPPSFNTPQHRIRAVVAGGEEAVFESKEGAEDSFDSGFEAVRQEASEGDVIIGMSASGSTSYVLGALSCAKTIGAFRIGVTCNKGSPISSKCDICIEVLTGEEMPAGSTRMKAGSAQKQVADILTTLMNVEIGNVSRGRMADLQWWKCEKLLERGRRILMDLCGMSYEKACRTLDGAKSGRRPLKDIISENL